MLVITKYSKNSLFLIIRHVLCYTVTFIFLLIRCVSFLTRNKTLIKNSITIKLNFVVKNNSFQTSESITILKFQFDLSNFAVK